MSVFVDPHNGEHPHFAFQDLIPSVANGTVVKKRREICQNFQIGKCPLGDRCPQRHVITQHRVQQSEVCKHWLRGQCVNGENCAFLHVYDERFVPECAFFQRLGECSNPECPFRHVHPSEKTPLCAAYQRGFCPKGPQCTLRHVNVTDACVNYLLGFCPLGPSCRSAHPKIALHNRETVVERERQALINEKGGGKDPTFKSAFTCHRCGDVGHLPRNCPGLVHGRLFRSLMAVQEPGEQPAFLPDGRPLLKLCYQCGGVGHESKECTVKPMTMNTANERYGGGGGGGGGYRGGYRPRN